MRLFELNTKQENRLSEISMGIGHIALVSMAIPALIDKFDLSLLILNLILAILFWSLSIVRLSR